MNVVFTESNWDRLLTEIEGQRVIPVVGPELLLVEQEGRSGFFYDLLAKELARRLHIRLGNLSGSVRLEAVAQTFLASHGDPADIYFEIHRILSGGDWPCPKPLEKLAEISHFNLFLTTTFDTFMKRALDNVRFQGGDEARALAYSDMGALVDLPVNFDQQHRPFVFQLFGKVSASPDYAVTEDDLLRFNHRLQSKDRRPQNLFDQLKSNYLLVLGCSLPDWLARFFFCATKGDLLFSEMGIRGVVADRATPADESLSRFFARRKTLLYSSGEPVDFLDELHRRWLARFGKLVKSKGPMQKMNDVEMPPFVPDSVFLSYASEDKAEVIRLKDALEEAGIDVWFDQRRLEPGDVYKSKILRNIEKCSCFVPIISRHTATLEKRFFRLEWCKAIEEASYWSPDYPFIQPVVIDETSYDAPNIPHEFRIRHWQRFAGGVPSDDFIHGIRRQILQIRRGKRVQA